LVKLNKITSSDHPNGKGFANLPVQLWQVKKFSLEKF
jgi:hypothetical protein